MHLRMGVYNRRLQPDLLEEYLEDMLHNARTLYGLEGPIAFTAFWDLLLANEDMTLFRVYRGYQPLGGKT